MHAQMCCLFFVANFQHKKTGKCENLLPCGSNFIFIHIHSENYKMQKKNDEAILNTPSFSVIQYLC